MYVVFSIASKTYEMHVNASVTVQVLGGISFHVMAKNWKHLKDSLAFVSSLECSNRNRVWLTSEILPNVSLDVGQSLVNMSLALFTYDISTS